jgi:hypothetical protein
MEKKKEMTREPSPCHDTDRYGFVPQYRLEYWVRVIPIITHLVNWGI